MKIFLTGALCFCALVASSPHRCFGQQVDPSLVNSKADKSKKVVHAIYEVRDLHQSTALSSQSIWESRRAKLLGDSIQIEVLLLNGADKNIASILEESGARAQRFYGRSVQMIAPVSSLDWFEDRSEVAAVYLPNYAEFEEVISEGLDTLGIPAFHSKGFRGQGVKIAVIDGSFDNYDYYRGSELPPTVHTMQFGTTFENGSEHGTQCAQIIYDIAPEAELWLIQIDTEIEFLVACDWIKNNGFDVVSTSLGFRMSGWPDGSSDLSRKVDELRDSGILVVKSVGNYAENYCFAIFHDIDTDRWNEFAPSDETNTIYLTAGQIFSVEMTWDDWPHSNNDYDLYLVHELTGILVDSSMNWQTGSEKPVERIDVIVPVSGYYGIGIKKFSASGPQAFSIFVVGYDNLEYETSLGSLSIPGDANGALAVGAVPFLLPHSIESFSSRGPTWDNRVKPELVAPDSVRVSALFGTEIAIGTSFACPHVAGAAAAYLSAHPNLWPPAVTDSFKIMCIDLGAPGPDNTYGWGLLHLRLPNSLPALINPGDKSVTETGALSFTLSASDADNDILTYSASPLPTGSVLSSSSGDFSWQPTYQQAGVYNVTISVTDGQATDQEAIQITVTNLNRAPVLASPGNKEVAENFVCSFTVSATDPDNDPVSYSVTPLPLGAVFSNSSGDFYWQPTYVQAGTYDLTFSATDGPATDQQSVQILVNNTNRPPASFDLTRPVDNDTIKSASALLRWHHAVDPDIGDVMNYTLYYSTADTSSWQHTVTSVADSQYILGSLEENKKYFWKVVAQDNAGATAQCTRALSFVAADVTLPSFAVDVLLNPVLPFELDLFFYPSESLAGLPEVTVTGSAGTIPYPASQLGNRATPCYVADYQVTQSGSFTISVCGTDVSTNHGCSSEIFSAARLLVNTSTELQYPSGSFRLHVPSGSAHDNGVVLCREWPLSAVEFDNSNLALDVSPAFAIELTSTVALSGNSLLIINAQAAGFAVGVGSTVVLVPLGTTESQVIPSRINITTGEFVIEIPRAGTYAVCTAEISKLESLPSAFQLDQNSPNPFNGSTEILFSAGEMGHVILEVFNILGQKVTTLLDMAVLPGNYSVSWNGKTDSGAECSSGTYFYRLSSGSHIETKKMLYLK